MSGWHDSTFFDLIVPGDDNYRSVGCSRIRTCHQANSARWHHIGFRGVRFNANLCVHDVPFVCSAEDKWTVVRIGRAYGCALDTNGVDDVPEDLRPAVLFSGPTWSNAWYYVDVFARFAGDIVLEF